MTATPAAAAASMPSGNGIEARPTRTRRPGPDRRPSSPRSRPTPPGSAGPAPMPTAWPSFTSTIEFDFTCPQIRHASSASRHSASVGARLVTTRQSSRVATKWWASCTRNPPLIWRKSRVWASGGPAVSRRVFLRLAMSDSIVPGLPARGHDQVGLRSRDHALRGGGVDRAVERDDAAERGALVALEGALVSGGEIAVDRDTARVGVLDDRDRGPITADRARCARRRRRRRG